MIRNVVIENRKKKRNKNKNKTIYETQTIGVLIYIFMYVWDNVYDASIYVCTHMKEKREFEIDSQRKEDRKRSDKNDGEKLWMGRDLRR